MEPSTDLSPQQPEQTVVYVQPPNAKSTGVAVFLSFLIPGLGSLYAGSILAGVTILGFWIVGLILTVFLIGFPIVFLAWVVGMVHAAIAADKAPR